MDSPITRGRTAVAVAALLSVASVQAQVPTRDAVPSAPAGRGVIRGTVFDSLLTNRPLAEADVFLDGSERTVRTDARGRFALDSIAPGRYTLTFYHPTLDAVGLSGPARAVDVRDGEVLALDLFTPGRQAFLAAACGLTSEPSLAVLIGSVVRGVGGTPIPSTDLTASWTMWSLTKQGMRQSIRESVASTDAAGGFRLCGVPNDVPIQLRAQTPSGELVVSEVSLSEGVIGSRRITVPDVPDAALDSAVRTPLSAPSRGRVNVNRGTAFLVGTVRTPAGRPVRDAQVALPDFGVMVNTLDDGSFTVQGLPDGPRWVEVRALGFRPLRARVPLAPGKIARLAATFDERITVLASLKVLGARSPLETTGFDQRRRTGSGVYLTAEDIEKRRAYSVNDLFTGIPGVEVRMQGMSAVVVISRAIGSSGANLNRCEPVWYVDGVRFRDSDYGQSMMGADISSRPSMLDNIIRPSDIAGIEVYKSLASVPPIYQPLDAGCGVILVWTKRRPGK